MLVLSRREGEQVVIGDGIVVTVTQIERGRVRLGIDAPRDVPIYRRELPEADRLLPATKGRTAAEVRAAQCTVVGCCNRHADNLACDCLERARGSE